MENCDSCNKETSFETGTYYSSDEFVALIRNGFMPEQSMIKLAAAYGIPNQNLIASLPQEISSASPAGWLLCPVCAAKAGKIQPKPAGNLPQGERGSRVDHAGVGKMAAIITAMGIKAMVGGATSPAPKAYKCDFCSKVKSREDVKVIPASRVQQAVKRGFHPFGKHGIAIDSIPPSAVIQEWRRRAMQDTTDWGLCAGCAAAFSVYTSSADSGRMQPGKKWWRFWR